MVRQMKLVRWFFWSMLHRTLRLFGWREKTIDQFIWWCDRRRWPWHKFKPGCLRNEPARQWEVYFADEGHYRERRTLTMDVCVSFDTKRVIGLVVWDELLAPKPSPDVPGAPD